MTIESFNPTLIVHGGAGTVCRDHMTPELAREYQNGLSDALSRGGIILENGGSALDAVEASVMVLEDNPLFNAGHGSVFTSEGTVEMDAAIMDGRQCQGGSVINVSHIRNPVSAAKKVLESESVVMLCGREAEAFARHHGILLVPADHFFVERRWEQLLRAKKRNQMALDHDHAEGDPKAIVDDRKYGTVGAVALDITGGLAAATSTGGLTNKRCGRVGDSPVLGAGTYANHQVGISATGTGEVFLRMVAAHDIASRMVYGKQSLQEAGKAFCQQLSDMGGEGGIIAIDSKGNAEFFFNTNALFRGIRHANGDMRLGIFEEWLECLR